MADVEFRDVSKHYGGLVALDRINLAIASGEFITLLGPSGSGKTTLLNTVTGMITPTSGQVLIDGNDVTHMRPQERGLGMVFQNYALMPHMTVFENVAFPLRIRSLPRREIDQHVMAALDLVRLAEFANRKPRQLSGGQQQRVSIARCLVYRPKVILMDEPLGALDKKLREQLQLEIKKIHEDLGITIIYVTHDQSEALIMSDRVCVMNRSRIVQVGTPKELYFQPRTEFVADFLGDSNLFAASVESIEDGIAVVRMPDGTAVRSLVGERRPNEATVKIMIRPEAVQIAAARNATRNSLPGVVRNRIFTGQATRYVVATGGLELQAQLGSHSQAASFIPGDSVWVDWSETDAILVAAHGA
jgi:putative spermidine/putrescine transport system ATP-binding protein